MNLSEYYSEEEEYDEPFQRELAEYLQEYEKELSKTLTQSTINKHSMVIGHLIDYLFGYHEVKGFEDITLSMISSKFHKDFQSHTQEGLSRESLVRIIKKFFEFIYEKHGVRNKKLMDQLQK